MVAINKKQYSESIIILEDKKSICFLKFIMEVNLVEKLIYEQGDMEMKFTSWGVTVVKKFAFYSPLQQYQLGFILFSKYKNEKLYLLK